MRTALFALFCFAAPALAQPVSLFDGKTLEGWESREPKLWKVEDGCITGGDGTKIPHNDFLCSKASFSNFVLKLKIKLTGDPSTGLINSGVQIRTQRNPEGHEVCGYQCDYGEPNWYAGIYDEGRRNKFIAPADMAILHPAIKLWDWNEYTIKAEGNRIQTWINGVPGVDYKEQDPNIPYDGILGVQVHAGGNTKVQLKDITIEELPATKEAPTWEKLGGVAGVKKLLHLDKPKENAAAPTTKRDISYNDVKGNPKTAEEELKSFHLPEGYEMELVVKESEGLGKFVAINFDQRGRLWTNTALEYPMDGNENPAAAEALYASKGKDKLLVYPREAVNAPLPAGGLTNPTIYADELAMPHGFLPWGKGDKCYALHGHDILLLSDTDGDGKADKQEVVLTGFGVQDSHLFPHQFTRAPGGWIWMAQGAFNNGTVLDKSGKLTEFPSTRMARFRPDGTGFEITSTGPCNIWGLAMTGEGETFIQEANDYGYPVMPFHEYANYPGCADRLFKSYAPHFPVQAPDFKMGGTGLSGLALGEGGFRKLAPSLKDDDLLMIVANPITSKIQAIAMHREDSRKFPREAPNGWKLDLLPDFISCDDPMFRPVGLTQAPDGSIYIVDWYNKIISHNEVARNHPDRDKIRGRIWRVKPRAAKKNDVPDFTKLSSDEL
ncbi:MAG: Heme-binding protein, partial [Verrucomicrobiaceae bacterium]|nr:Heme-binding protein [Verrucomicrobiaceae bacterium]